jgi:hypothetical protein
MRVELFLVIAEVFRLIWTVITSVLC